MPEGLLDRVAHLIPDANRVTIQGGGHNVHANRLEECMAVVGEFLEG